ncbi:haloacid dehalogenase type II [Salipaludibacillus sp. CF4.18]|uniref:haloacid dehalogenase type II n=1 Tax=Salipaludibacillus sp. CF4.18 TaxID=3373081 RepID=UPI003EE6ADB2
MIKTIVFDAYGTLYDVYSIEKKCEIVFPNLGKRISVLWREKQIEYSFLRQLTGNYVPFYTVTKEALRYACKACDVSLDEEKESILLKEYLSLDVYPEVEKVLEQVNNKQLVIFSNGSRDMLEPLVKHSVLAEHIHQVISVDDHKQYKPCAASYYQVLKKLSLTREEVLFVSSNSWDIIGAKTFGFKTLWVNRKDAPTEEMEVRPDYIANDIKKISEIVN